MKISCIAVASAALLITGCNSEAPAPSAVTAVDFQKVYEVPLKADEIIRAAGQLDQSIFCTLQLIPGAVGSAMNAFSGIQASEYSGNITIDAKDGRYRLTMENLRSIETSSPLSAIPLMRDGPCKQSMELCGENLHQKIKRWKDF